jgi:hypothetical protein
MVGRCRLMDLSHYVVHGISFLFFVAKWSYDAMHDADVLQHYLVCAT